MSIKSNQKFLAMFLVISMLFACCSVAVTPAYADDVMVTSTDPTECTATISIEQLGQTDMVPTEVTFTEGDNLLDVLKTVATVTEGTPFGDAAFITAINDYPASDSGISWMFKVNGKAPELESGLQAAANQYMLHDGDYVEFYSINYTDGTAYAAFDKHVYSTTVNTTLRVRLSKEVFDENWMASQVAAEGATILVSEKDADEATEMTSFLTDENGRANIMFTEAGTYIISARKLDGEKQLLSTTYAEVTVTESDMNEIDIVSINDFHGNVDESGKNQGMAKIVGYINSLKEMNPNTVVVSAGDNYQGSAISNLTCGAPVNEMFVQLDTVASAIGNHEFDWGTAKIPAWSMETGIPFLASNIYDNATGEPVDWAMPYTFTEIDGVKIAFLGLSTMETITSTKAENVKDLTFKPVEESAEEWVDFLEAGKAEEGTPDLIIALTHVPSVQDYDTGVITGEELDALTKVEGIDAVITGHSHKIVAGEMNGVPVLQAYKYGRAIGIMKITLDENNQVTSITPEVISLYKLEEGTVMADQTTADILAEYNEEFGPIKNEVIGKLDADMLHSGSYENLTKLGYFTCDVMRKAADVQIGITNGGGLRTDVLAGDVTMGNMYEIMPFDNTLVTMNVTGADLYDIINHGVSAPDFGDGQFAGIKVVYDPEKDYPEKVISISLEDGTPIEMDGKYSIVVNDFMATGGDSYDFSNATDYVDTFVPIRDALVEEFRTNDMIYAPNIDGMVMETKTETYMIQAGDVLWKIAAEYNTTIYNLGELNDIENLDMIYAGDSILVPSK